MNGTQRQQTKWERCIEALLATGTHEEAARRAKVSARALRLYLADPAFQKQYRAARRAVVDNAVSVLQRVTLQAVLALARNLTSGRPASEVAAAKAILDLTIQRLELDELKAEVEEVVQRYEREQNERHPQTVGRIG